MTKRNILPAVTGFLALSALFAFTFPQRVREQVITLLFPNESPAIAMGYPVAAAAAPAGVVDTFPPLKDRYSDFVNDGNSNPIDLKDPGVIEQQVEYDPVSGMYIISEKIGDEYFRTPTYMNFDDYVKWRERKQQQEYFDRLQGVAGSKNKGSGITDPIAGLEIKNSLIDRLFGGTNVDIHPQGNINLTFGFDYQKIENPILTLRQQRSRTFDFDMDINMSATGKIGEKLNLNFNYNTQATFDFDNQMKLHYDPKNFSEDEILQNIEAGNVSMPLKSNLIKGAQNLFGAKVEMKFGHLNVALVGAQQRSKQQSLNIQGGSQVQQFDVPIDEYDENRHFLISHWNRGEFEANLSCLPVPQSLFTITRMEVWMTNDRLETVNVRDIVALTDLSEPIPYNTDLAYPDPPFKDIKGQGLPVNENNKLYPEILTELGMDSTLRFSDKIVSRLTNNYNLKQIQDFEKVRARLLSPTEYTFNEQLGFISINLNVQPDQVVGVALEYTYNGIPYKIGEFTSDVPAGDSLNQNVLFTKMLKSTTANVKFPIWDLMMKNVYAVGAVNVDPQEFRFDIFYEDPGKGQKRFLNGTDIPSELTGVPLLQVFKMDNLNLQGDPGPDGIFDFVPGLTVNLRSGRVMFPVLEPFGSFLEKKLTDNGASPDAVKKYAYNQLYDSTLFKAREFQQLNRFNLRGTYKSSTSSEISLGTFNLPRGSVRVSAGGRQLVEGSDYEIDYNIGRIKILNDAILQSGQSVNVSYEDNSQFGFQSRTMLGARLDYEVSKDINVGATFMNLFERPLTQKVNFGDDPINNKVYGLDFNISKDAPWLTKALDKLPLIETKAESSVTAQAEVALLDPGHNRAINQGIDKGGVTYIDDFEGSTSNFPLTTPANGWVLASVPQGDNQLFPEAQLSDSVAMGANRAALSWYVADPQARDQKDGTDPYTRLIQYQDIFPNRQLTPLELSVLSPLDVTIYPRERGPYNFEKPDGFPGLSQGLLSNGQLNQPQTRWAGFMRGLNNNNDFEATNIEFIEFWMLNPYMEKKAGGPVTAEGDMYIDLGTVSEDIMRDSRQFFENALPTGPGTGSTVNTAWGRVPVLQPVVNAFDNDPEKRKLQDLGLDGMDDEREREFYKGWINEIKTAFPSTTFANAVEEDPSNDNFKYFLDGSFPDTAGLLRRYRQFNNTQGNSPPNPTTNQNPSSTTTPDMEDLNRDNSLNENESYFRYKIRLADTLVNGQQVINLANPNISQLVTDTIVFFKEGVPYVWYRFKLPLDYSQRQSVGGIQDFRSIRFIRMFWKGFTEQTTFRFATLELGRNQWRRFNQVVADPDCDRTEPAKGVSFDINSVSIEENSARQPFNYTIPYGISREQSVGAFPDVLQNEQSLSLNICDLPICDGRAIFKSLNMDLRQFKRMKMFVHAESVPGRDPIDSTQLSVFIRMGSDFYSNYYEYEIPLTASNINALNGNPDSREYKDEVWRPENDFDLPLELFTDIKKARNADLNFPVGQVYEAGDPDNPKATVRVLGNPNLGYVKGIMIGVRNVDYAHPTTLHCVETWFNELRLVGFNEKGGYAAQARADVKLADLGNVSFAGNYSSIGWGSIEQKLIQRQREEVIQYDVSTNIELSKLLPEKVGLRLPFYAQYSNTTRNPEYDPYDLDIKLADKLRNEADPFKRDSIRTLAQDVTIVRGYNFTNVRKERTGGGAKKVVWPWAIENFSVSYAYNQTKKRTPFVISDEMNQYKAGLDYQYSPGLKPITPFKKLIKKDKYLKFISEFNFNPLPGQLGFSTNMERIQQVTTYRFADESPDRNTYYNRRFTWDRNYDLNWDFAKSLRFSFDANARSIIDEPYGKVSKQVYWDSVFTNMKHLGRPKGYNHNASLSYTLPFKYIPMMDWITMKASYTASYTWTAQSLKLQHLDAGDYAAYVNSRSLGNVIQNNSSRQINGDFNLETLYNKSKYLQKINKPAKSGGSNKGGNTRDRGGNDDDTPAPAGGDDKRSGGKDDRMAGGADKGKDLKNAKDQNGAPTGGPADKGKTAGGRDKGAKSDDKDAGSAGKAEKEKNKDRQPSLAERIAIRPLMLVRKARFNYSENFGTIVPGFTPDSKLMGLSEGFQAPGWDFVAGFQPNSAWLDEAARKGWITQRPELNQQVMRNYTQNFDASATIEPFNDFRIELTANKQYTRNSTELYKDQNFNLSPDSTNYQHRAQRDMGSFTVSYFALNTLFDKDIDGLFSRYRTNRSIVSQRLGIAADNIDPHENDGPEYTKGYGKIQQEVLIPSFVAAYTEANASTVGLDIFKTAPALNWKLNYNGLSKLGNLKKVFSSVQISHGYKSSLTINSFNTDLFYSPDNPYVEDPLNNNYIARYEIPQVVISEQLQPLLGVDMKLKNDMTFRLEMRKSRTLAMSFIDYQLAETQSTAYTAGFGYRLKNVNIPFLTGKKAAAKAKAKAKRATPGTTTPPAGGAGAQQANDMTFKFDFDYRDDITVNHSLDQLEHSVATRGARTISINPSVDYTLNKRLKLRLFTDYRKTVPKTSQSYPITSLSAGVTVQFTLN